MNRTELRLLQALPLEIKVAKTKQRVREWIDYYGVENVYASFSGGVGSTVLYFILQEVAHEQGWDTGISCLFVNTRNEYPSVVRHVYALKAQHNAKYKKIMGDRAYNCPGNFFDCIDIRLPKKFIRDVIKEKGYLVVSKKTSRCIGDIRRFKLRNDEYAKKRIRDLLNHKYKYSVPKRWQYLIDLPVKISVDCCHELKHSVYECYEMETGRKYPITGEQACESSFREDAYLKYGCNGFARKKPKSTPLAFWTQSDLLCFIKTRNLPYPECYGDIVLKDGQYMTTGEKRTGCMFCTAGITREEKEVENRFQRMERLYPVHYKYLFSDINEGGLGVGRLLDLMQIPYHVKEIIDMEEWMEMFN